MKLINVRCPNLFCVAAGSMTIGLGAWCYFGLHSTGGALALLGLGVAIASVLGVLLGSRLSPTHDGGAPGARPPTAPGSAPAAHILLVEDEVQVQRVVERALTGHGYTVTSAKSGRDAIEILERESGVDLVLTDFLMPEMSGDQLARELERRHCGVKVAFMSGSTGNVYGSSRPDDRLVLEKPFTRNALIEHVEAALRARG